ncbi:MAG: RNA polymerase factor sigma-54 [Burkholderiaceae bacterium]
MPSIDMRAAQRQSQTISPRLQQAVRLLQMSSLDFAAMIRDTLSQNPFLEGDEGGADDAPASPADGADGHAADAAPASASAAEPLADGDADLGGAGLDGASDRDFWQSDASAGVRRADDAELSAMETMAVETGLNMHLHGQINVLALPERDLALARTIIESLDDDGYLRTPLDELLDVPGLSPAPTLAEMRIALRRVQALEPAGVAARSVGECLLLQMPAIGCPSTRALATAIVEKHLGALAARNVAAIARELGEPAERIEQVCERIRRLDPRPGWRLGSAQVPYVVPDVVVKKRRGQWTVQLNPAVVPKVRLNQMYATLFQRHQARQHTELSDHLREARWTLRNVEQRFSTILDVAEAIVRRQRSFLEYGAMAMKPLGLKEIAEEVGIHESTVSRVTNNKFMATPVGVFELKYFFSRAMISASGHACSGTAVRGLIRDIIAEEDPDAPLSDAEIARQLARQGLVLARRTVTNYRQMLKIEPVERRRRRAAAA